MQLYNLTRADLTDSLRRLYRYAPWNPYTIDVITRKHLYLATAGQMNDEWEFRIHYVQRNNSVGSLEDMFHNLEVQLTVDGESVSEPFQDQNPVLWEADAQIIDSDRENIGTACFTVSNNNSMMWYHYADRYSGVCMEFTNFFSEDILNRDGVFGRVSYGDYPNIDIINESRSNPSHIDPLYRFFYKANEWKQEKEYRYIVPICQRHDRYFPFDNGVLSAIYCGFRMEEYTLSLLYDLATRDNDSVTVYRSSLRENGFGLEFNEYTP